MKSLLTSMTILTAAVTISFGGDDEPNYVYPGYDMTTAKNVVVTLNDGTVITGENVACNKIGNTYLNIKVKDASGNVTKIDIDEQAKEIIVKDFNKLLSLGSMHKADREIRYIVIDRLDKPGTKVVCQQLNYDGTDKMIIYNDPEECEWSSIPMTGITYLDVEGYYVSVGGAALVEVTKKNYKKEMFSKLFDACQSVKDKFGKKKDIDDFDEAFTSFIIDCK
jgi:hypothetical protein